MKPTALRCYLIRSIYKEILTCSFINFAQLKLSHLTPKKITVLEFSALH